MKKQRSNNSLYKLLIEPLVKRYFKATNKSLFERFEGLRNINPYQIDKKDLETILVMFRTLIDEYEPTRIFSTYRGIRIRTSKPDIEQAKAEIKNLNRSFLSRKKEVPSYAFGNYEVHISDFFVDSRGRYIPISFLRVYLIEVLTMINYLLDDPSKEITKQNTKLLSDLIYMQAIFALTLCDDLKHA